MSRFDPAGRRLVTAGDDATVRVWDAADGRELAAFGGFDRPVVAAPFTPDGRDVIGADPGTASTSAGTRPPRTAAPWVPRHPGQGDWVETLAISPLGDAARRHRAHRVRRVLGPVPRGAGHRDGPDPGRRHQRGAPGVLARRPHPRRHRGGRAGRRRDARRPGDWPSAGDPEVAVGCACYAGVLARRPHPRRRRCLPSRPAALGPRDADLFLAALHGHAERLWCVAFCSTAAPWRRPAATARSGSGTPRCVRTRWCSAASGASRAGSGRPPRLSRALRPPGPGCERGRAGPRVRPARPRDAGRTGGGPSPEERSSRPFALDGSAIAVNDDSDRTNEAASGVVSYYLAGVRRPIRLPVEPHDGYPRTWSPDGKRLAVVDRSGWLTLWDASNGRPLGRAEFGFESISSWPAFLPAGDAHRILRLGDPLTPPARVHPLGTGAAPTRATASGGGARVRARHGQGPAGPRGGKRERVSIIPGCGITPPPHGRAHLIGHSDSPTDMAFSPDGRTLATTSLYYTVRLWNVATGLELLTLEGHTSPVPRRGLRPTAALRRHVRRRHRGHRARRGPIPRRSRRARPCPP